MFACLSFEVYVEFGVFYDVNWIISASVQFAVVVGFGVFFGTACSSRDVRGLLFLLFAVAGGCACV